MSLTSSFRDLYHLCTLYSKQCDELKFDFLQKSEFLSTQVSLSSLEKALHVYTLGQAAQPFDMKTVPVAPVEETKQAAKVCFLQFPECTLMDIALSEHLKYLHFLL